MLQYLVREVLPFTIFRNTACATGFQDATCATTFYATTCASQLGRCCLCSQFGRILAVPPGLIGTVQPVRTCLVQRIPPLLLDQGHRLCYLDYSRWYLLCYLVYRRFRRNSLCYLAGSYRLCYLVLSLLPVLQSVEGAAYPAQFSKYRLCYLVGRVPPALLSRDRELRVTEEVVLSPAGQAVTNWASLLQNKVRIFSFQLLQEDSYPQ